MISALGLVIYRPGSSPLSRKTLAVESCSFPRRQSPYSVTTFCGYRGALPAVLCLVCDTQQKSRSSEPVSQSAPVITGSLIDRLRARTVFGGMGTTDTQSTMHVPLASNASSTDAEHRTFQEYCCALLNRGPDTSDGDMDA